jgi:osmotically-inducible protein OsmY
MRYVRPYNKDNHTRWQAPLFRRSAVDARTQADRLISERLKLAVEQLDLPDVTSISVYVKDGLVTIQGLVTSRKEVSFVAGMAKRVDGVRHVITHLKVVSPEEIEEFEAA